MTEHLNEVALDWPPADLSPNARVHWARKSKSAKKYRADCFHLARIAHLSAEWLGPIKLEIIFYPPNNRKYDIDNAVASIKSGLDGLADAMKVNDSRFKLEPAPVLSDIRGGKVSVRVHQCCNAARERRMGLA